MRIIKAMKNVRDIFVPVSPGELLDKITILEVKAANINDIVKVTNIKNELSSLKNISRRYIQKTKKLLGLIKTLKKANENLWVYEERIRRQGNGKKYDRTFIALAKRIHVTNDLRGVVKKKINMLLGSRIIEEKSYLP